jgi:hypothetical protein
MGRVCSAHGREKVLVGKTDEWDYKENPGVNKRMIFELILDKFFQKREFITRTAMRASGLCSKREIAQGSCSTNLCSTEKKKKKNSNHIDRATTACRRS